MSEQTPDELSDLDRRWKAGDPCASCGSTNTGEDMLGAFCRSCKRRDDDD